MMEIITTKKWNDFCFFEENRVKLPRSKFDKLRKSIETKTYIISPILVMLCQGQDKLLDLDGSPTQFKKHKYAVVDGQNRLLACKELNMTPTVIINSNIVRDDLVIANNTASSWTMDDYIIYWHKRDKPNYSKLIKFISKYKNHFKIGVIADAFTLSGSPSTKSIKDGSYAMNELLGERVLQMCLDIEDIDEDIYRVARFVRALKQVLKIYPEFNIDKIQSAYDDGKEILILNNESKTAEEILKIYDSQFEIVETRAIPEDMRLRILARDGHKCVVDGCNNVDNLQIDHKKPWSKYGKTELSNLETLCEKHNKIKSDKWLEL